MKKLVLAFAVIATVSMASCTGNSAKQATGEQLKADTTMVNDSAAVDSVAVDAPAQK